MINQEWERFRVYGDRGSAEAAVEFLESEGVPAKLEGNFLVAGVEAEFQVYVAKHLAHRARWVFGRPPLDDEELDFLATGKLPGEE